MKLASEEPQEHVADAEPAQRQPEQEDEPHVAEAEPPRVHGVDREEQAEPDRPTAGSDEEPMPVPDLARGEHEEGTDGDRDEVDDRLWQLALLEVDHRQHGQARRQHHVRRQGPGGTEAGRRPGEQARRRQLDERVLHRDRRPASPAAPPEHRIGQDGDVVERARSVVPQPGQRERGATIDSPRGTR